MKRSKLFLTLLLVVVLFPTSILAKETEVGTIEQLSSCTTTNESTCKLTQNIILNAPIEIAQKITIDLNGHSITPSESFPGTTHRAMFVVLRGATLTVNDSVGTGKISVVDRADIYSAIKLTKTGESTNGDTASLVVNGGTLEGYYYAIAGNGDRHDTSIIINNGTIKGLESTVSSGIFHPQDGTLTINGGTISGITGIEMRSGTLIVKGGTIIGNGDTIKVIPSGSGSTTLGVGIAIAQHTTAKAISVKISGGTIKGKAALYESNPQNNSAEAIAKVSIDITGGTFGFANDGENVIYSQNKTGFITGGTFSTNVTTYVKTGYESISNKGNYTVSKINNEVNVPVVDTSKDTGTVEEVTVGVAEESKKIEEVLLNSLDSSNLTTDNKVEVALEIETLETSKIEEKLVKEMEQAAGNAKIASYFDITVAVRDFDNKNLIGTLPELTEEIELMILLPEELKNTNKDVNRIYYVVRKHDEKVELLKATLSKDGKYLVFKTNKFSTYALAYEDVEAEEVLPPKTNDSISISLIIGALTLICLVGINTFAKKKNLFN